MELTGQVHGRVLAVGQTELTWEGEAHKHVILIDELTLSPDVAIHIDLLVPTDIVEHFETELSAEREVMAIIIGLVSYLEVRGDAVQIAAGYYLLVAGVGVEQV